MHMRRTIPGFWGSCRSSGPCTAEGEKGGWGGLGLGCVVVGGWVGGGCGGVYVWAGRGDMRCSRPGGSLPRRGTLIHGGLEGSLCASFSGGGGVAGLASSKRSRSGAQTHCVVAAPAGAQAIQQH